MSICIISDYIIMAKTKFHYNTQHIDQVKPKYEGGGFSPQSPPPPPPDPPLCIYLLQNSLHGGFFVTYHSTR